MTAETLATVLKLADEGARVEAMCATSGLCMSRVYGILREYRPNRPRQSRRPTSSVPAKVRALAAIGTPPKRIAHVLQVSASYVYQILGSPR